ncbi:hypothetical protein E2C01_048438 [Portunus trituberculatus]|uniref:Uncharacterized protein n=1 Tax=Portunus trituberculatus TaxID=210409 RepID=A0A5B7GAQ3_PORTR|nr:hypothetical protein [Portunus trituberculatus]
MISVCTFVELTADGGDDHVHAGDAATRHSLTPLTADARRPPATQVTITCVPRRPRTHSRVTCALGGLQC